MYLEYHKAQYLVLFLNIFLCDLFFVMNVEFASYADDNTPYAIRTNIEEVIVALEDICKQLFQLFSDNQMTASPDKWHLICSTDDQISPSIESEVIKNSKLQKIIRHKI